MAAGELFSQSWQLFVKNWKTLFFISLITVISWKVWSSAVAPFILTFFGVSSISVGLTTGSLNNALTVGIIGLLVLLVVWSFVLQIAFWGGAAVAVVLDSSAKGQALSAKASFTAAKKFLWPLSWVSLIMFAVVLLGFILLLIPGLIFLFLFQFFYFAVVSEGKVGWSALSRSAALVRSSLWKVLFLNIMVIVLLFLFNLILGKISLFSFVYQTLVFPFVVTSHYSLYKSLVSSEVSRAARNT